MTSFKNLNARWLVNSNFSQSSCSKMTSFAPPSFYFRPNLKKLGKNGDFLRFFWASGAIIRRNTVFSWRTGKNFEATIASLSPKFIAQTIHGFGDELSPALVRFGKIGPGVEKNPRSKFGPFVASIFERYLRRHQIER